MHLISEYSFWWLLPIFVGSALATWYFLLRGKELNELPPMVRRVVATLRFLALSIVGILLLGLLFEYVRLEKEQPILLTLIDNSSSLENYRDSAAVKKQIKAFQDALQQEAGTRFEQQSFLLGQEFREGNQVDMKDIKTDLSSGFEAIFSRYYNRNVGAIILVSDGNFNEGQHPMYAAGKIPFTPVFTLGVGDTTAQRDQLIKDVITNEIAFMRNRFPVEVDLEAFRLGGRNATVSISKGGKVLASQQVKYQPGAADSKQLLFELEADQPGFQQYVVEVKALNDEYTTRNNRRSFYMEVLDSRNKILLLSAAPHPDISALKSVLENDENIEVQAALIDKWDKNLTKTDLVIWHEPGNGFSESVNQTIINSKIPVLYFTGVGTPNSVLQKLGIGLSYNGGNQLDEVQAGLSEGFDLFELSDELQQALVKWPPVVTRFGTPKLGAQNRVFLHQRLVNIQKKEPLMFFGSDQSRKYGVFLGDGIWRWRLDAYQKQKDHHLFHELFQKTAQYLVQRQNSSNLRVTLPKRFLRNEEILIKAEFYNEAMELITKPSISFSLTDAQGKKSDFQFGVNGKLYLLPLGKLRPGTYHWTANTSYGGKKYSKSGNFVVEDIQLEKLDTRANHEVLQLVSNETKGKYYALKDYQQLLKDLAEREDITTLSHEESSYESLLDYFLMLLTLLLLLGTEWFLNRWYGAY